MSFYDYLNVVDDREDLVDVGHLLAHQLLEVLGLAVQPAKSSTGWWGGSWSESRPVGKKRHQYNSSNKLLLQNTKGFAFPNPVNDERERVKRGGEA